MYAELGDVVRFQVDDEDPSSVGRGVIRQISLAVAPPLRPLHIVYGIEAMQHSGMLDAYMDVDSELLGVCSCGIKEIIIRKRQGALR